MKDEERDQSLPVVVFKSGMSSTSSQDLVLSETDLSDLEERTLNNKQMD